MYFSPKTVIDWYKSKPKWFRLVFFVVLVVGVVLAGLWWFFVRPGWDDRCSEKGALEALTSGLEDNYKNKIELTKSTIEKNEKEIEKLEGERAELEEQRKEEMKENEKKHKTLDNAVVASDIVDSINAIRSNRNNRNK